MSFVAISKVIFPHALLGQVHEVGLKMLPIAKRQPGFISISFHNSLEENETMIYWEWETRSDHEACMQSSDWAILMEKYSSLFQSDGVEFSIQVYDRLV